MRWIKRLSNVDIEKLVKKLGVEYDYIKRQKHTDANMIELKEDTKSYLIIADFKLFTNMEIDTKDKIFYLFMESKFGKEYLIDLIRHKTGLSGKFLRKKLK